MLFPGGTYADISAKTKILRLAMCMGAAYQCRSSRVWPDFVLYLEFVQHMTSLWPDHVLVLSVTSICLQNQTFDFIKSSICPAGLTYVLNLSSDSEQIGGRNGGQNLDKNWTSSFCHLPSSHPSSGQKLDNVWTLERQKFVHVLSKHHFVTCPTLKSLSNLACAISIEKC